MELRSDTVLDLDTLEVPEIAHYGLMVRRGDAVNGANAPADLPQLLTAYDADLTTAVACCRGDRPWPPNFTLFVPDLWHVAFGRAKLFPKQDGQVLWDATVLGLLLGRQFMAGEEMAVRHNYPGTSFRPVAGG